MHRHFKRINGRKHAYYQLQNYFYWPKSNSSIQRSYKSLFRYYLYLWRVHQYLNSSTDHINKTYDWRKSNKHMLIIISNSDSLEVSNKLNCLSPYILSVIIMIWVNLIIIFTRIKEFNALHLKNRIFIILFSGLERNIWHITHLLVTECSLKLQCSITGDPSTHIMMKYRQLHRAHIHRH